MKITAYLRSLVADGIECPLETLAEKHQIKVRDYPEARVVILDYDQFSSVKSDPIAIECRSLIIDRDDFRVISRKFDRFFNFGEMEDYYADFNFGESVAFEKVDGSLCAFWYNPNSDRMEVSTRNMAMAEGTHQMGGTFREKILAAGGLTEDQFQALKGYPFFQENTVVFEFISPENRIVTRYDEPKLVLLSTNDGEVENYSQYDTILAFLQYLNINTRGLIRYDRASNMEEMIQFANSLPDLQEGFVVLDPTSGKRVKVKSSVYLYAHRLRGEDVIPSRKNILKLIFEGEVSEVVAYYPEFRKYIDPIEAEVELMMEQMQLAWNQYRDIESQREFAIAVKDLPFSGVLFTSRKLNQDPIKSFRSMATPTKMRLFGS